MKKSELVVNKEYYVCSSNEWMTTTWDVKRVRIVNLEHGKWKWIHKHGKYEQTAFSTGRTGLVVEQLNTETGAVQGTTVVTLASIRGEWEPTAKMVAERRVEAQTAADAAKQAQLLRQLKTGQAVALAKQMEVPGVRGDVYGRKVEVDPEIFKAMLNALDATGWKYTA